MPTWITVAIVIAAGIVIFYLMFGKDLKRAGAAGDDLRSAQDKINSVLPWGLHF